MDGENAVMRATPEQTYMNNWPEALWKLTFPGHKAIEISAQNVRALVARAYNDTEGQEHLAALKDRLEAEMEKCPWFIRLNSRSPKDYRNPPITMDPQEAIDFLTLSMRTVSDLEQMMVYGEPCVIYLRRPVSMAPGTEFRCFVKDGKLIAISQYDGALSRFPEESKDHIISALSDYAPRVTAAFPYSDFVFDVFFVEQKHPCLIEVNPYGLSNPCFFWAYEAVERGGYAYAAQNIVPLQHRERV
jgi:hypothetical protein